MRYSYLYDNNIIENVRATKLLGADIIFMPMLPCAHLPRPGAGLSIRTMAEQTQILIPSERNLTAQRKGMAMKWLPSRAYDNGVYVVFSNPIGMDHDQLKTVVQ